MKKTFILAFLTLLNTSMAYADNLNGIHDRFGFSFAGLLNAVRTTHQNSQNTAQTTLDIIRYIADKEGTGARSTTAAILCDAYVSATKKHNIQPVPCSQLIALVIQEHNATLDNIVADARIESTSTTSSYRATPVKWHQDALSVACRSLADFDIISAVNCGTYAAAFVLEKPVSIDELKQNCLDANNTDDVCERFVNRAGLIHNYYTMRQNGNVQTIPKFAEIFSTDNRFVIKPYDPFDHTYQEQRTIEAVCHLPYTTNSVPNAVIYDLSSTERAPHPIGLMYVNIDGSDYYGDTVRTGCVKPTYKSEHSFYVECHDGFSQCDTLHGK